MSKVIGVIPARYGSTRFPGKPLAKIANKEMILWVLAGAAKAKTLNEILVATDDERIALVVRNAGGRVVMTDSELPTGTDRIHAAIGDETCDVVVNIQGDEPLITGELIDALVRPMLEKPHLQMATLGHELSEDELDSMNSVKVIANDLDEAIYFSRFAIPYSRVRPPVGAALPAALKHIGLYAYRRDFLAKFCQAPPHPIEIAEGLEQLRALAMGAKIAVVKVKDHSMGVDSPDDVKKIEEILRRSK